MADGSLRSLPGEKTPTTAWPLVRDSWMEEFGPAVGPGRRGACPSPPDPMSGPAPCLWQEKTQEEASGVEEEVGHPGASRAERPSEAQGAGKAPRSRVA